MKPPNGSQSSARTFSTHQLYPYPHLQLAENSDCSTLSTRQRNTLQPKTLFVLDDDLLEAKTNEFFDNSS
jgi:hypothetical protein